MGFLEKALNSVLGKGSQQSDSQNTGDLSGLNIQAITQWVEEQGGFQVLLEKLQQGGLGNLLTSWLGQGDNQPVDTAQLQSAFDHQEVQSLADKLGTTTEGALGQLKQALPQLIDKLSSNGQLNLDNIGSLLGGVFGKK